VADESTSTTTATKPKAVPNKNGAAKAVAADNYQLPIVGVHVPARIIDAGFWGGLAGAAALGAIDPPLAILVGAGVVVARHHAKK
jgi:hypothetical protein